MAGKGNNRKRPPQPPPPPPVSGWMDRSKWTVKVSNIDPNVWSSTYELPTQELNDGLSFNFTPFPRVESKMMREGKPLAGILMIQLVLDTTGAVEFLRTPEVGNDCDAPAKVRVYVEHPDWQNWYMPDGSEKPGARYQRWWSNPIHVVLPELMTVDLNIPITPDQWSSVYGEFGDANSDALYWFNKTMGVPLAVGLAFGAGCFFGHGVYISGGTAKFTLKDFKTQ